MIRKVLCILIVLMQILFTGSVVTAQKDDVVYAVLFQSPTCTYCVEVMKEVLPAMESEFGPHLRVVTVNVYDPNGAQILQDSCDMFDIEGGLCGSLPTLIVGDTVMFGGRQIREELPDAVREGIDAGGVPLPRIPELDRGVVDSILDLIREMRGVMQDCFDAWNLD